MRIRTDPKQARHTIGEYPEEREVGQVEHEGDIAKESEGAGGEEALEEGDAEDAVDDEDRGPGLPVAVVTVVVVGGGDEGAEPDPAGGVGGEVSVAGVGGFREEVEAQPETEVGEDGGLLT